MRMGPPEQPGSSILCGDVRVGPCYSTLSLFRLLWMSADFRQGAPARRRPSLLFALGSTAACPGGLWAPPRITSRWKKPFFPTSMSNGRARHARASIRCDGNERTRLSQPIESERIGFGCVGGKVWPNLPYVPVWLYGKAGQTFAPNHPNRVRSYSLVGANPMYSIPSLRIGSRVFFPSSYFTFHLRVGFRSVCSDSKRGNIMYRVHSTTRVGSDSLWVIGAENLSGHTIDSTRTYDGSGQTFAPDHPKQVRSVSRGGAEPTHSIPSLRIRARAYLALPYATSHRRVRFRSVCRGV